MWIAEAIVTALSLHSAIGLLFGIVFILIGVQRVDTQARGTSLTFRLLILPGVAALWPFLLWKWCTVRKDP